MNKYFNTDVFLKNVKQKAYPQSGSINESERKISLFGIMEILTAMPTTDVVEVVHGEWVKITIAESCGTDELHRTVYRDRETVKCSECGNPSPVYNIKFEFCPRCGAKMDGEK